MVGRFGLIKRGLVSTQSGHRSLVITLKAINHVTQLIVLKQASMSTPQSLKSPKSWRLPAWTRKARPCAKVSG